MIQYDVSCGLCVLRVSPRLTSLSFPVLEEFQTAIARANDDGQVCGIVITAGPDHFPTGADLHLFEEIVCDEDALRVSRVFQEAFGRIEDSAKPVVAAVGGWMIGGALELAIACHARVCTPQARFQMPEVTLGINPGAGGTQRLPRLIGPEAALKMLLTGETIDVRRAIELGLVDAVCDGDKLIETARGLIERLRQDPTAVRATGLRTDKIDDAASNAAGLARAAEQVATVRPEIIAPAKILEAVRTGLDESFAAGLLKEQQVFAQCMATPATQNKIYLFFATRRTGKVAGLDGIEPGEITTAAVVGMGSMGAGIAQAMLGAGVPVIVHDQDPAAMHRGVERIRGSLQKRVEQGKLSPQRAESMLSLITEATSWVDLAPANLVVEAVFEDVAVKRSVLANLERVCPAQTVIASNTSTISFDRLAQGMQHPEQLVGMHFFNPAHRMPLVEIVRHAATSLDVLATALGFAKRLRKTPVVANNREGFLVNRLFIPYLKEAFWLLEDGADPQDIDAAMVEFGFPMGPLALIDMAGLDILAFTDRVLCEAFPHHGPISPIVTRLVEQGHAGQKTGAGVYKYQKGDYTPYCHDVTQTIIAEVRRSRQQPVGGRPEKTGKDQIAERLVLRMVAEAFRVLEEGVAQRESDLDVAMVLGTGFPDFRGGVIRYAYDLGIDAVVDRLEQLEKQCGERFSPCERLRQTKGAR